LLSYSHVFLGLKDETGGHDPSQHFFIIAKNTLYFMAKKQGGRLLSSAGLVNYYESEDRRAIHISPLIVMAVAAAIGIIVMAFNIMFKTSS
jgi:preprotein translocase subunit Sec61beta